MQWLGQTAVVSISRVLKHRAVLCAVNVLPAGLAGEELFPCQALELVLAGGGGQASTPPVLIALLFLPSYSLVLLWWWYV